jgi:hypothetical protein
VIEIRDCQLALRPYVDLAAEITWLRRVARAYATSPIVPRTVALLGYRSAR